MSNETVVLDVRNFHSPAGSGYTNVTAVNSSNPYSYRYTGGTDGHGGITEIIGQGAVSITVNIQADSRYRIADCIFSVTTDLSWVYIEGAPENHHKSIIITDTDVNVIASEYSVKVIDHVANLYILCDPPIRNRTGN